MFRYGLQLKNEEQYRRKLKSLQEEL
jgi:hypothetical protein